MTQLIEPSTREALSWRQSPVVDQEINSAPPGHPLTIPSAADANARDRELLLRMTHGGHVAQAEFYDLHAPRVFGLCLSLLGDRQLAEATLVEVFAQTWEQAATGLATSGTVSGWLTGITHHLCLEQLRHLRARSLWATLSNEEAALPWERWFNDPLMDKAKVNPYPDRAMLINQALAQLILEQRLIIQWSYFQGLTAQQIAEHLQCPEDVVHGRARLALQNLRQHLAELGLKPDAPA